jgi:hypothetical protein
MPSKKRKLRCNNTTGFSGVFKNGERFRARIFVNKKETNLGTYDTPEEAAVAYDRAVINYNLSKDKLNWPGGYPKIITKKKKKKLRSNNATGYRGVCKSGERIVAQIFVNNKQTHLGIYDTAKEAAVAFDRAVIKYNLSKDKLNWPDGYPKINTKKKKRKLRPNNTTGYRGVTKSGQRFKAQILINTKSTYLGTYDTPKEAAVAYDRALIKYNLSKDKLNFSNCNYTNNTEKEKEEGEEQKEEEEEEEEDEDEDEDEHEHEHEQELDWNSIIEQSKSPFFRGAGRRA